jgi:hypothetical protein
VRIRVKMFIAKLLYTYHGPFNKSLAGLLLKLLVETVFLFIKVPTLHHKFEAHINKILPSKKS